MSECTLHPAHHSMRGKRRVPRSMTLARITPDQVEVVEKLALSIFTEVSNSGWPFAVALSAIYLTGAQNALEASSDE